MSDLQPVRFYWAVIDEAKQEVIGLFPTRLAARWFNEKGVRPAGTGQTRLTIAAVQGAVHYDVGEEFRNG